MSTSIDPWRLSWSSPFPTHEYESLYLANGVFGGQLDLSGTDMDLWSASIAALNQTGKPFPDVHYPVTALRTRVFYRNAHYKEAGFWMGRSGILCDDPRYRSNPSIPHQSQVYQCHQELDLRRGVAETSGTIFPGTQAALEAGLAPGRAIDFKTRVALLKDSPLMVVEITADEGVEIAFLPQTVLEDKLVQKVSGHGVCQVGTEIDCELVMQQEQVSQTAAGDTIEYAMQPKDGKAYTVRVTSPGARAMTLMDQPALLGTGTMLVYIQILPEGKEPVAVPEGDKVFAQQAMRWEEFWSKSDVRLPAEEALWQQRYHASLFYVAQSIGEGPTHPPGLSKPNLPHWFGCFHDTDTYFCRPLLETGRRDEAVRHLRFRHATLPNAKANAQAKGYPGGAMYPWQSDPEGNGEAYLCPLNSAIIGCEALNFFYYLREAEDRVLARDILEPSFELITSLVEEVEGKLTLKDGPVLTFSETMEAERPVELTLALHAAAADLLTLAEGVGEPLKPENIVLAKRILEELEVAEDGAGYAILPAGDPEYLRTPSVSLGAFPLHTLKGSERLAATFDKELGKVLLLFAWLPHQMSVVGSMLGRRTGPSSGHELLRQADVFYKPWHAFDEWENRRTGRAENFVTAAGGFASALHNLLLTEVRDGIWGLLPGAPESWANVAFSNLVTRSGWRVSVEFKEGQVSRLDAKKVNAASEPELRLQLPEGVASPAGLTVEDDLVLFR